MKKKVTAILLTTAMMAVMAAGCGKERSESGGAAAENGYTIGIQQFAEHGSLDNCREGFIEGLAEEGIVDVGEVRGFDRLGYQFEEEMSSEKEYVFLKSELWAGKPSF